MVIQTTDRWENNLEIQSISNASAIKSLKKRSYMGKQTDHLSVFNLSPSLRRRNLAVPRPNILSVSPHPWMRIPYTGTHISFFSPLNCLCKWLLVLVPSSLLHYIWSPGSSREPYSTCFSLLAFSSSLFVLRSSWIQSPYPHRASSLRRIDFNASSYRSTPCTRTSRNYRQSLRHLKSRTSLASNCWPTQKRLKSLGTSSRNARDIETLSQPSKSTMAFDKMATTLTTWATLGPDFLPSYAMAQIGPERAVQPE